MSSLSPIRRLLRILPLLALTVFTSGILGAQEAPLAATEEAVQKKKPIRPAKSDAASLQLIANYLTVIGGKEAFDGIDNIKVSGSIKEGLDTKDFDLVETSEGQRKIQTYWKHLGRPHSEVQITDGQDVWKQTLKPKEKPPQFIAGQDALHFKKQNWFLHPFREGADYIFKYGGPGEVGNRETHIVIGFDAKGERTWFYFDKEKFLLLRWGGYGIFAGTKISKDYQATQFKREGRILFPKSIELLADGNSFGSITIESLSLDEKLEADIFKRVTKSSPLLKQRSL